MCSNKIFFAFPISEEQFFLKKKRQTWLFKLHEELFMYNKLAADDDVYWSWDWS